MKAVLIFVGIALCVAACAGNADLDARCAAQRPANSQLPWAYFPGYGCGPIPPAETNFG